MGGFGAEPGQLTRPQGLAVDAAGRVFVADAFQSEIRVFDAAGRPLGVLGAAGAGPAHLALPADVALDAVGRLLVTSYRGGRLVALTWRGEP